MWLAPKTRQKAFILRLLVFGLALIGAAVLVGAGIAWLGAAILPESWREATPVQVPSILLAIGVLVGLRELRGGNRAIPQLGWQVPRHWLKNFWLGACVFGGVMGMGFLTRQVSLLFHLYLLGTFLSMNPVIGAVFGAIFGLTYFGFLLFSTIAWREMTGGGQDEAVSAWARRVQVAAAVASPSIALIPAV